MSDRDYGCNADSPVSIIAVILDDAKTAEEIMRELDDLGFAIAPKAEIEKLRAENANLQGDMRWAVNLLLESIAQKFEDWATWDLFRSEAAATARSFKHDLTKPADSAMSKGESQ